MYWCFLPEMSMLHRTEGNLSSTSFILDIALDLHSRCDFKTHNPKRERSIWIASWVLSGSQPCPICAAGEPSWRTQLSLSHHRRSDCNTVTKLTKLTVFGVWVNPGDAAKFRRAAGLCHANMLRAGAFHLCVLEYQLCNLQQALVWTTVLHHTQQLSNGSNRKPFSCHQLCTFDIWRLKEKTCFKAILLL